MSALYASRGFEVIGIDTSSETVQAVNDKRTLNYEPGLPELLRSVNIKATIDYEAILDTEITFIMLPSPSGDDGYFRSDYVEACAKRIAPILATKTSYHVVVVVSTLMPNTMKTVIAPHFKGTGVGLCYNPTFVAIGNILKGLSEPDAVVIGESNTKAGNLLGRFYLKVCLKDSSIRRMSFVNAELCKLLLNCFITTKISIANTCAEICEQFAGGDADVVMSFLGADSRIGKKCLKGGTGYGGTCFPRDSRALVALTKKVGVNSAVQMGTGFFNDCHDANIGSKIRSLVSHDETISVLGLTYKPDTALVDESSAVRIVKMLVRDGRKVRVYDPQGMNDARKELGEEVYYSTSIENCLKGTSLCVIAVDWQEFKVLDSHVFTSNMKTPRVLDVWRIHRDFENELDYYAVGVAR